MNSTLLSTINVMNFNNISSVRSAARKAYGPSTDFLFSSIPVAKSFSDYIDRTAEQKVNDFMTRYNDSSSELTKVSRDLKQLYIKTFTNKEVQVDSGLIEAVAKQDAMIKSYEFAVEQLATTQQDTSNAFKEDERQLTEFGTVDFTVEQGDQTYDFSIAADENNTNKDMLKKMASAINKSEANISAKVLSDTDGNARLALESTKTGSENAFTTNGDITDFLNIKTISTAENARYSLDGESFESSSNTVTLDDGQLEVTFKEETSDSETLAVALDTADVKSELNDLANSMKDLDAFLTDYTGDSRIISRYERRLDKLMAQFESDLQAVGITRDSESGIRFSETTFDKNFEKEGTKLLKSLDEAGGFSDQFSKFTEDFDAQDVRTLAPAYVSNNLPTFMQDDFLSYLSLSSNFNIQTFYPTGGILDFML
ncbi:MAG: hypothetical protein JXO44_07495 [Clostridia bacterium]|nr:hypothetical protein [Clostridia bacterium]